MKYRIIERFDVAANKYLYFIQYKNNGMWLWPQETFQEASVLLQNITKPDKVMYELEIWNTYYSLYCIHY